ncbi:TPA: cellulose biosynthesis protein BcsO [Pluralibacter gergoviae]
MNHYDDLQRFKDKTRTQKLAFKDLSGQSSVAERGDWAIINQLSPGAGDEKKTLGTGGSVSHIIPQPVSSTAFDFHSVPAVEPQPDPQQRAVPPVAATPVPPAVTPVSAPVAAPAAAPLPDVQPVRAPRPAATGAVNYARLFAAKNAPAADKTENQAKDLPLKSLLERIASCR